MDGKWSIDENGKLVVQDLEVKGKARFGTPENPQGITIYDQDTRDPYCVGIKSGEWVRIAGECGQNQQTINNVEVSPTAGGETSTTTATTTTETTATSTSP